MMFQRGVVTDYLLDALNVDLEPHTVLVGDHIAPEDGGWTGGQPGEGNFVPYIVLTTLAGRANDRDTVGQNNTSWLLGYSIRAVGASRTQCDWAADVTRMAVDRIRKVTLEVPEPHRIQQVRYAQLGPITRNDATDPPYFELVDSVDVWLEAKT